MITMTHVQTTSLFARVEKGARPDEVGDLVSVFEKSTTELKQKLHKCKRTIQIAIFNVRTLNEIAGCIGNRS